MRIKEVLQILNKDRKYRSTFTLLSSSGLIDGIGFRTKPARQVQGGGVEWLQRDGDNNASFSFKAILLATAILGLAVPVHADDDAGTLSPEKADRVFRSQAALSPYAGRNFPTRPLFGDTHLHTGMSFDAGAFGARLTPRDAYRFARGEEIIASSGQPAKLSRPLDFLVVADHSDNMGMFPDLFAGKPELLADPQAKTWYDMIKAGRGRRGGA